MMRPFDALTPFADARRLILDAAQPIVREEKIALREADGRVLAADVVAEIDVPPFDRAAMDGYAVIAADVTGATPTSPVALVRLRQGAVFAGASTSGVVSTGECVEIATGARLPTGADAVVMVEDTSASASSVTFHATVELGRNVGRRGADLPRGHRVLKVGDVLTPSRIGVLAALGRTHVEVFRRPSVILVSTGDEIVPPGVPLRPGQLYDVNQSTLASVVGRHGGMAVSWRGAGDTRDDLLTALDAVDGHDIAVFSGGSSVGTRDLVVDAVRERGEVLLHGIAVKPGKPTLFARVHGTPVFGMPGYPTSCLSNAYLLLAPFLRAVARLPAWRPETITLPLSAAIRSVAGRHQFYSVRVREGRAEPAFKSSGDITSLADADGYIEISAETGGLKAGEHVTVTLFQ